MCKKTGLYLVVFLILAGAGLAAANYKRCSDYKGSDSHKSCDSKHGGEKICLVKCGNLPCPGVVLKSEAELELTESQVAQIKALYLALKKEKVQLKADIKILEIELTELLDKKEVDKIAVDAKVDKIAELAALCTKKCIQAKLDTRGLLTDAQIKKLKTLDLSGSALQKKKCDKRAAAPKCQDKATASAG